MAQAQTTLSASHHRVAMVDYMQEGRARAFALGNRGPIRYGAGGSIHDDILDAYWRHGFYVFEGVIGASELEDLRNDVEEVLDRAPVEPRGTVDRHGRPAIGLEFERPSFSWSRPLSDPVGGTARNGGRHPVKMDEPVPDQGTPSIFIDLLIGNLQLFDSALRLYGHPDLLEVAAAVNGPDFVPFNEVVFLKEPGLGVSVAWHQDGTTHWDAPDWDMGTHGFNFMAQIYGSTPANGVWVVPGSHRHGKADIAGMVADSGSERIASAVPMVCESGDVVISNRQLVHGSFANTSSDRRVTVNFGFLPRKRVLGVTNTNFRKDTQTYTPERLHERSRMIAIGIDARQQKYPNERRYCYQPLEDEVELNRWNEQSRETVVKNYNLLDVHL